MAFANGFFASLVGIKRVMIAGSWYEVADGSLRPIAVTLVLDADGGSGKNLPLWTEAYRFEGYDGDRKVLKMGRWADIQAIEFWRDEEQSSQKG